MNQAMYFRSEFLETCLTKTIMQRINTPSIFNLLLSNDKIIAEDVNRSGEFRNSAPIIF